MRRSVGSCDMARIVYLRREEWRSLVRENGADGEDGSHARQVTLGR